MHDNKRSGLISALTAYVIWGFLPIYWKQLGQVPSQELLAWRVAGCAVLAWTVVLFRRRPPVLSSLIRKEKTGRALFLRVLAAAVLIALNWGIYLWAVEMERMVEASLGYYINPLVNVVLGIFFFSEKLGRKRLTALILALIGVIIMTVDTGVFPWISLLLALSFGLYGLATKQFPPELDSIEALAGEMLFLGPLGAAWLIFMGRGGAVHIAGYGPLTTVLLLTAGLITLLPLWLFGRGAKSLPLGVLGFLQYVAPTTMLLLGVFVYGEPFSWGKGAAFLFILAALSIYSSTILREQDG
jgi:chloramphenicol-sensitive protein RarD